jgi:hypothetical protein
MLEIQVLLEMIKDIHLEIRRIQREIDNLKQLLSHRKV